MRQKVSKNIKTGDVRVAMAVQSEAQYATPRSTAPMWAACTMPQ